VGANRLGLTRTVSPRLGAHSTALSKLLTALFNPEISYSPHLARATAIPLLLLIYFSLVKNAITEGGTAETVQATTG
jgi:hypothetical protein